MSLDSHAPRLLRVRSRGRRWWRERVLPLARDFRWPLLGLLAVVALILGFHGLRVQYQIAGLERSFWDILFASVQLFLLEIWDLQPPYNPVLSVARYLAPMIAGYTALSALAEIFRRQFESLRLRLLRGHVVICGLGAKGEALAREFLRRGYTVVAIEQDDDCRALDTARERGCIVLIGDGASSRTLRQARVARAAFFFAVCGDDSINAALAVHAAALTDGRTGPPLRCAIHIFDFHLYALLRERALTRRAGAGVHVDYFNIFDIGARAILADCPVTAATRLVVIGAGRLGESVILTAAREWHALQNGAPGRFPVTLIDRRASAIAASLVARHPALARVCEFDVCEVDVRSAEFLRRQALHRGVAARGPTLCCVCLGDRALGLSTALVVARQTGGDDLTIVTRLADDAGVGAVLRSAVPARAGGGRARIEPFAFFERTCQPDEVLRGTREVVARAIHQQYVHNQRAAGDSPATNPLLTNWSLLTDAWRDANRAQADDIVAKLEAIGCEIDPQTDWDEPLFAFSAEELENLSEREHRRWREERERQGWRHGPVRDNAKKKHPSLVDYAALPEAEKEKDRNAVREIPVVLARAGFRVQRAAVAALQR